MWSTWTLKAELHSSPEDWEGEGQCGSGKLNVDGDRFCCRTQHQTAVGHGSAVTLIREEVWKELKVKNRGYSLEAPVRAVVTANGEKTGISWAMWISD